MRRPPLRCREDPVQSAVGNFRHPPFFDGRGSKDDPISVDGGGFNFWVGLPDHGPILKGRFRKSTTFLERLGKIDHSQKPTKNRKKSVASR
jgi:hypothetical protein